MSLIKRDTKSPSLGGVFANLKKASVNVVAETRGELVLMLDKSGSMRGEPIHELNLAARAVINDCLSKVEVTIIPFPGCERMPAQAFISLRAGGDTPMDEALCAFSGSPEGSQAILMSDGHPSDDVRALIEICADRRQVIHTVACGDGADEELLRWIAERTGGTFHRADKPINLTPVFLALGRKAVAALTEGRKELAK